MELTRRSDYACRIIRAAYESKDAYVSVSEVAEKENIPYAFARSIQHDLVHAGLLKTVRGAKGGLSLACDPSQTTLLEVLEALQDPANREFFLGLGDTPALHTNHFNFDEEILVKAADFFEELAEKFI